MTSSLVVIQSEFVCYHPVFKFHEAVTSVGQDSLYVVRFVVVMELGFNNVKVVTDVMRQNDVGQK